MHGSVPFSRSALTSQRALWVLAAITLVGLVLRCIALGQRDLWGDEVLTLVVARYPAPDLLFQPVDPTGPLYYLFHKLIVPPFPSAAAARFPALLCGILTIPACYALGRAALDRRAGLMMALLAAVSPQLIDFSQEARAYALLLLLVTVSAAALVKALTAPEFGRIARRFLAAAAVAAIAACYTHPVGYIWLGLASLIATWELYRRRLVRPQWIIVSLATVALVVLPELLRLHAYAASSLNEYNWLVQLPLGTAALFFTGFVIALPHLKSALAINALFVGVFAALCLWIYVVARSGLIARVKRHHVAALVGIALISFAPLAWLVGEVATPIFIERSLLQVFPGIFLLFAAMARVRGGWAAIGLMAIFWLGSAESVGFARSKFPWRQLAAQIESRPDRPDVIICPDWTGAAYLFAAAHAGTHPGAIILFTRRGPVLVKDRGTFEIDPLRRFRDVAWGPKLPAYAGKQAPAWRPFVPGRSLVAVRYLCHDDEWQRIVAWVGEGSSKTRVPFRGNPPEFEAEIVTFSPLSNPRPILVR